MVHANAAIFVPHAGCPHRCAFCDQRGISGARRIPDSDEVAAILGRAAESLGERMQRTGKHIPAQIAFFGGSFTAIPQGEMLRLLEAAQPFLREGLFSGIRISTRPDAVGEAVLDLLAAHGVTAVELGAQSMSDTVLSACGRGHTAGDVSTAAERIRARGFSLGLQMMTGLPLDDGAASVETARRFASLRPDTVRIYPTLVLENTPLAARWQCGGYRPQTLAEAVALGARLLDFFVRRDIQVIRLGLHDSPTLQAGLLAGPYHPAFRELCEGRVLLQRALEKLEQGRVPSGGVTLEVARGSISKMAGHKRANLLELERRGYRARIIESDAPGYLEAEILSADGQHTDKQQDRKLKGR